MKNSGFTIVELMLSMALFTIVAYVSFFALQEVAHIFRKTMSRDNAVAEMMKAHTMIQRDLTMAKVGSTSIAIHKVPPSLGGGADSDAIEFLTPLNLTTAANPTANNLLVQKPDGSAFMMYNIIYYAVVPSNHIELFGINCTGGNQAGYDYNCPHKILMRLIQDENSGNDPTTASTEDVLLSSTSLANLLTRPMGFPHTEDMLTVAINLLSFRCTVVGGEVQFDIQSVALDDAQREAGIGNKSFLGSSFTVEQKFSIYPQN